MTEKWLNNVKEATPGAAGERGHSYSLSKVPSSYSMSKMHILLHVQDILLLLLLLLFLAIAGTKHMINPEKTPKEILVSGLSSCLRRPPLLMQSSSSSISCYQQIILRSAFSASSVVLSVPDRTSEKGFYYFSGRIFLDEGFSWVSCKIQPEWFYSSMFHLSHWIEVATFSSVLWSRHFKPEA